MLLSAGTGAYIWAYDDSTGEPEFKFTMSSEEDFADYQWTVSSDSYDAESGTGTYTLKNEENGDYLAAELNTTTVELARYGTASDVASLSGYGTAVFTVTINGYNGSNPNYYTYLLISLTGTGSSTSIRWYGHASINTGPTDWVSWTTASSAYCVGDITLSPGDVITITVVTSKNGVVYNFYNENTAGTYIQYVPGIDFGDGVSFGFNAGDYGSYTIIAATASYDASVYDTINYVTENATSYSNGEYSYTVGSWSQVGVDTANNIYPTRQQFTDEFDTTYSFTNTSNSAGTQYNYVIEVFDGSSKYITLRADDVGWTAGCSGETFTYETVYDDFTSWSDWQTLMRSGAACTVRVIRTGDTFFFITTASGTVNGKSVSYTFVSYVTVEGFGNSVYVYLVGEQCTLSGISYVNQTARNYNETSYNRLSASSKTISVTAADSDGSSVGTASYLWSATATGSYKETFALIAQLATDTGNTAEIEWVEDATAGATTGGTAEVTLSGAAVDALASGENLAVTFSFARVREYTVFFDGTNGNTFAYRYSTTDEYVKTESNETGECYTTLKTDTVFSNSHGVTYYYQSYELEGWYDITHNEYYAISYTDKILIEENTVFYADWVVSDYDFAAINTANNTGHTVDGTDTSGFITTRVLDYNDLINLFSSDYTGTTNQTEHSESWYVVNLDGTSKSILGLTSWGFVFYNGGMLEGSLMAPSRGSDTYTINTHSQNSRSDRILDYLNENSISGFLKYLFDTEDSAYETWGKTYVGDGNYLFQYNSENGYFYYDAELNAASYGDGRFQLYDYTVSTYDGSGSTTGFLPFNEWSWGTDSEGDAYAYISNSRNYYNAAINYYFGMTIDIDFYLPNDVGDYTYDGSGNKVYGNQSTVEDANGGTTSRDMIFQFTGDDDVWVMVDGYMVLDLGGIHGKEFGEINFSTGTVTIVDNNGTTMSTYLSRETSTNGNGIYTVTSEAEVANVVTTYNLNTYLSGQYGISGLSSGVHTLTIYYLERGAGESNFATYFNISSDLYSLELAKVDEADGTTLDGAQFTFYTDAEFEDEALLATTQDGDLNTSTFDANQRAYGLVVGKTYYVAETAAPEGYTTEGKYFTVIMSSTGQLTVTVYDTASTGEDDYLEQYTYNAGNAQGSASATATADDKDETEWDYILDSSFTGYYVDTTGSGTKYYTVSFTVQNTACYELPATGGIGTCRYMEAGEILVSSAGVGLIFIAFYRFVRLRRNRANGHKGGNTKEEARSGKHCVRARERPHEHRVNHGHARDRPGGGR